MISVVVNGSQMDLDDGITVGDLLVKIQAPERGIAVAKNDRVVRRSEFASERLSEGDRLEIIKAVAGG